jgi:hypothetical protein
MAGLEGHRHRGRHPDCAGTGAKDGPIVDLRAELPA